MAGYVGADNWLSKKVELTYDSKSGGWYCQVGEYATQFYRTQLDAARAGNSLALRTYGNEAQLINAEQFIG